MSDNKLPDEWGTWERERKIEWLSARLERHRLLELVLGEAGVVEDYFVESEKERLTTEELAEIYVALSGK